jgi:hypothetical protein
MNSRIQQLQQELASALRKADLQRRILKISQRLCYGGAALYFAGLIVMYGLLLSGGASSFVHDYASNPNPTFWEANKILILIIPLFALITAGSAGIGFFYQRFAAAEQHSVRRIVKGMFPEALCYIETSSLSTSLIKAAQFFHGMIRHGHTAFSFGSILFDPNGQKLDIRDIVIHPTQPGGRLAQTHVGGMIVILKTVLGGLFARRVENTASSFRGLFAHARLSKTIQGSVVMLPDHLERRLDYLAQTIQSLQTVNGNKLVKLEDVEFERYFAVYATDEILARYLLTPAMMLRITELRKKYNRDIMLAFNGDRFFFAAAMPEGFLTLGRGAVHTGKAVHDLYDNIAAVREILRELKLDKAPETTIRL